jgi:hypothetical protein
MDEIKTALDDLIQLAKPPTTVAPIEDFLQDCIDLHLRFWKRDVLAHFELASRETWRSFRASKDQTHISHREFAQEVRAYDAWLWDSVRNNRALYHDVYVALVGPSFLSKRLGQR